MVICRHSGNGAVIARCSQPEVGWLGWRSSEDEDLLKAISDACAFDKGPRSIVDMGGGASAPHTPTDQTSIIDGDLSSLGQERPIDAANLQPGKVKIYLACLFFLIFFYSFLFFCIESINYGCSFLYDSGSESGPWRWLRMS